MRDDTEAAECIPKVWEQGYGATRFIPHQPEVKEQGNFRWTSLWLLWSVRGFEPNMKWTDASVLMVVLK